MAKKPDKLFFGVVIGLTLFGFFIFSSAALGLVDRDSASFNLITVKQLVVLLIGFAAFLIVSRIDYRWWRAASPYLFIAAVLATLLVFVPDIGLKAGGAYRWIKIGPFSIQPSEFLKLAFVFYLAAFFAKSRDKIQQFRYGLLPFLILSGIVGILMVLQPDIDTLVIMLAAGVAMFYASGARWRHLLVLLLIFLVAIGTVAIFKPYIIARVKTFLDRDQDVRGASYQINQSLIAIGSGGLYGRGFGQSIQKFQYLPEPIGDSVFSVASEEFGFLGSTVIVSAFLLFALAGMRIAARAPTGFGRLVAVGIVIMIMTGTFINIASMLGLIPLTGTPLLFISHGGTALLLALVEAGIILNISRQT